MNPHDILPEWARGMAKPGETATELALTDLELRKQANRAVRLREAFYYIYTHLESHAFDGWTQVRDPRTQEVEAYTARGSAWIIAIDPQFGGYRAILNSPTNPYHPLMDELYPDFAQAERALHQKTRELFGDL